MMELEFTIKEIAQRVIVRHDTLELNETEIVYDF